MNVEDKVKEIFANLFQVDQQAVHDKITPDEIPAWDSMQHLNLTLALEEEFNISITPEDAMQMLNFGLVVLMVKEKLEPAALGTQPGMAR